MVAELKIPNFGNAILQGMQARKMMDSRETADNDAQWKNEVRERQRGEWARTDQANQQAKIKQMYQDIDSVYRHIDPEQPDQEFDTDFENAANWFLDRNPEGKEAVDKILSFPTEARKDYIRRARKMVDRKTLVLDQGDTLVDKTTGETVAQGSPKPEKKTTVEMLMEEQAKYPEGSRQWQFYENKLQKDTTRADGKPRKTNMDLWLEEQKKYPEGSREWQFYENKIKKETAIEEPDQYDDQTVTYLAEQLNTTGRIPINGRGKSINELKRQVILKAAEMNVGQGKSGSEAVFDISDRKAIQDSIKQQEKQYGSMTSFVVNLSGQVDKVKELAKEMEGMSEFDTRWFNMPVRWIKRKVSGDPELSKYGLYLGEIQSEIGKLSSGSTASVAELSEGAREKWEHVLDENLSLNDMIKVLEEVKEAGNVRLESVESGLLKSRDRLRGVGRSGGSRKEPEPVKPPAAHGDTFNPDTGEWE